MIFGMFTHGGVNGLTRVTREYQAVARCLALALKLSCPEFHVTSLCITCNTTSHPHRDVFNLQGTSNAIIPIVSPSKGGELWIAGSAQEPDRQRAIKVCNDQPRVGYLYPLQEPLMFDPREWHATHRWTGDRMTLVGCSLHGISRLSSRDVQQLKSLGFPLPKGPSSCPTLRLKRFLSKGLTCCQTLPSDLPNDAYFNEQQGRHAEDSPGDGRDSAQRLDQGPAQVENRRAERGPAKGHDGERCVQGDQQAPDKGGNPSSPGASSDRVLQERQLGPDEGALDEALHDQPGATVQDGLPGLRQVRRYGEVVGQAMSYMTWTIRTMEDNPDCHWRLRRFGTWAKNLSEREKENLVQLYNNPENSSGSFAPHSRRATLPSAASSSAGPESQWDHAELIPDETMRKGICMSRVLLERWRS